LYGPPGTGKTAFARWLAEKLQMPLNIKRISDILSAWVGESEQNIARAFATAEQNNEILLIDEVDSFLQDRRNASHSWEVTKVNEFLTQMESFSGIFIASTNLVDSIDQASLRRFDIKLKFDYMQIEHSVKLFQAYCQQLNITASPDNEIKKHLINLQLTPGDFAALARAHRFKPINNSLEFISMLKRECELKENGKKTEIGFVH